MGLSLATALPTIIYRCRSFQMFIEVDKKNTSLSEKLSDRLEDQVFMKKQSTKNISYSISTVLTGTGLASSFLAKVMCRIPFS